MVVGGAAPVRLELCPVDVGRGALVENSTSALEEETREVLPVELAKVLLADPEVVLEVLVLEFVLKAEVVNETCVWLELLDIALVEESKAVFEGDIVVEAIEIGALPTRPILNKSTNSTINDFWRGSFAIILDDTTSPLPSFYVKHCYDRLFFCCFCCLSYPSSFSYAGKTC